MFIVLNLLVIIFYVTFVQSVASWHCASSNLTDGIARWRGTVIGGLIAASGLLIASMDQMWWTHVLVCQYVAMRVNCHAATIRRLTPSETEFGQPNPVKLLL